MLSLTREAPDVFQISDHRQEVQEQLLVEANKKLYDLQSKLLKIESQRVKNVNDTLLTNELS